MKKQLASLALGWVLAAAAAQFLKFLQSAEAKKVFEAAGFQTAAGF